MVLNHSGVSIGALVSKMIVALLRISVPVDRLNIACGFLGSPHGGVYSVVSMLQSIKSILFLKKQRSNSVGNYCLYKFLQLEVWGIERMKEARRCTHCVPCSKPCPVWCVAGLGAKSGTARNSGTDLDLLHCHAYRQVMDFFCVRTHSPVADCFAWIGLA